MSSFKKLAAIVAVSTAAFASSSFAAGVAYSQLSTTGLSTSTTTVSSVLDDITFAAGATSVRQQLSAMSFGVGVAPGTAATTAGVFVDFYDTLTPTSATSVVSDYLGGFSGMLTITANTATTTAFRAFTFSSLTTLTTPIYFTDNNIAIVVTLTDSTGQFYSTILTPLLSVPGVPTVGVSTPGVYRDSNSDGTFQAGEFNATAGNLYLSLTTVNAPVPEPSTLTLSALGGLSLLLGMQRLRRRRQQA